jgi:hypothetical protein
MGFTSTEFASLQHAEAVDAASSVLPSHVLQLALQFVDVQLQL